jgi:hypothetical protein
MPSSIKLKYFTLAAIDMYLINHPEQEYDIALNTDFVGDHIMLRESL